MTSNSQQRPLLAALDAAIHVLRAFIALEFLVDSSRVAIAEPVGVRVIEVILLDTPLEESFSGVGPQVVAVRTGRARPIALDLGIRVRDAEVNEFLALRQVFSIVCTFGAFLTPPLLPRVLIAERSRRCGESEQLPVR